MCCRWIWHYFPCYRMLGRYTVLSTLGGSRGKKGRSIFFPIPPGGWADSYHLTFLSEPFDLFVGPFENGFLLAVCWGYSSIGGGGRNKNGTSQNNSISLGIFLSYRLFWSLNWTPRTWGQAFENCTYQERRYRLITCRRIFILITWNDIDGFPLIPHVFKSHSQGIWSTLKNVCFEILIILLFNSWTFFNFRNHQQF